MSAVDTRSMRVQFAEQRARCAAVEAQAKAMSDATTDLLAERQVRINKLTESRRLYYDQWVQLTAERDALQAQVSELRAALRDIAECASHPLQVNGGNALPRIASVARAAIAT